MLLQTTGLGLLDRSWFWDPFHKGNLLGGGGGGAKTNGVHPDKMLQKAFDDD